MTWNWWCHDAVTQSRVVWVIRVLTHLGSLSCQTTSWHPLQMGVGGFAASPAYTCHGDMYRCKRVMAPFLWGRWQKGHGENVLFTHAISSLLCTRPRHYSILPLNVPLLWIWAGSKTGESFFGRLSVPVVSTSTCGSSRYDTLKNCTGFQKYRSEVIIDHRNNEMQWE